MKGKWAWAVGKLVVKRELQFKDGLMFALARFKPKPITLSLGGIVYPQVDHTLWSAILEAQIFQVYFYRPQVLVRSNDTVVDIGAHWGAFTTMAAKMAGRGTVHAYEPDPTNFTELNKVIDLNTIANVKIHQAAVGGYQGTRKLYQASSCSQHSLIPPGHLDVRAVPVPATTLDNIIAAIGQVNFLKIDCEGAEFEIIQQASDSTFSNIETIAMEVHEPPQSDRTRILIQRLKRHYPFVRSSYKTNELGYVYAAR